MSRENVELLQRGVKYFVATGEPLWDQLHPDIEVYDHDIPDPGQYRGHAGYARWLEDSGAAWAGFTVEPERYIDAGDKVVVELTFRATGRGSGIELERRDAVVVTFDNGLMIRLDYFNNPEQALEAAGLSE